MSQPEDKSVLDYKPPPAGPVQFSTSGLVTTLIISGFMALAVIAVTVFFVPRVQRAYVDYGMEFSAITRLMFHISTVMRSGGWIAIALAVPAFAIADGFLVGHGRRRWGLHLTTVLLIFFAILCVPGIFLPYLKLMESLSKGQL